MAHIGQELALGNRRALRRFFGGPKALLRRLAVRDVQAGADVAGQRSVGVVERSALVEYPAIATVVSAQAELDFEIGLLQERTTVALKDGHSILGMNALGPALPEGLIKRATREVQPDVIEVGALRVWPGHPHHHRGFVRDRSEKGLVDFQALLFPRADVQQFKRLASVGLGLAQRLGELRDVLNGNEHVVALGIRALRRPVPGARQRGHRGVQDTKIAVGKRRGDQMLILGSGEARRQTAGANVVEAPRVLSLQQVRIKRTEVAANDLIARNLRPRLEIKVPEENPKLVVQDHDPEWHVIVQVVVAGPPRTNRRTDVGRRASSTACTSDLQRPAPAMESVY